MTATVALLNRIMSLFHVLRGQLAATAGPELRRFMDQLAHKIRGNLDWQRTVPRCTTVLDVLEGGTTRTRRLTARAARPPCDFTDLPKEGDPLLPASIAWWSELITTA